MTAVWLFLGFLVLVGCLLISVGELNKRALQHNRELLASNARLTAQLLAIRQEARAQLDAGNPDFAYLLSLTEPRKERELS
jgi:hypothetical protein